MAAAARTTISSLKAIRSSRLPPPRATISTSGRGTGPSGGSAPKPSMAAAICSAAPRPCTGDGPEEDAPREAPGDGGADVLDDRAALAGDHADDARQQRDRQLALGVEQPFLEQTQPQPLDPGEQRALAGVVQPVDDELVLGPVGVGGDAPGGDHLHAVLRPDGEARHVGLPDHRFQLRALVLQREVDVAGGVALELGDLAAHAHPAEGVLPGCA